MHALDMRFSGTTLTAKTPDMVKKPRKYQYYGILQNAKGLGLEEEWEKEGHRGLLLNFQRQ